MNRKQSWLFFLALALTLIVLRQPSYEMPLDPDSGGTAFLARQMLRGETLYDKFHPTHHLPAVYYTFELAFRLFGDNPLAPKYLLLPWTLACAWLIYLMGRSFFSLQSGILAAFLFVLVSSQRWLAGMTVEMQHFANLPLIASFFLGVLLLRKEAPAWQFLWVGMLGAVSLLYQVTCIAPLVVSGVSILLMAWISRGRAGVWKATFSRLVWLSTGFVIPLVFVAAYFAGMGLWQRFLLLFKFGFGYVNDAQLMGGSDLPRPFGFPLFWLSLNNIAALIFALLGTYRLVRRSWRMKTTTDLTDIALALWLIVSLALAGLRGGGFAHYIVPVIPPLALLAAVEIDLAYRHWKTTSFRQYAGLGAGVFVVLILMNFIWTTDDLYGPYLSYKLGRISHESFLHAVSMDGYASQAVANYLKANTAPDDFVYIWSIYVDVYYYADRTPPIDILWPSYVGATGSPERIFDPRTKYIVLDTPKRMDRPPWLLDGLAAKYRLETTIEGREVYRRTAP